MIILLIVIQIHKQNWRFIFAKREEINPAKTHPMPQERIKIFQFSSAAWSVKSKYRYKRNENEIVIIVMLMNLGWPTLSKRRSVYARRILFYDTINNLAKYRMSIF